MNAEEVKRTAKESIQLLKRVAKEREYALDDIGEPAQLIKFAAEVLPNDTHPLTILWLLDMILENGKNVYALLLAAEPDCNMDSYRCFVRYIRRLALTNHNLDIHCGENGLEAIEMGNYEALLLSERLRQDIADECHSNDYKILEALDR